jgi:transcription elongation factor GreA
MRGFLFLYMNNKKMYLTKEGLEERKKEYDDLLKRRRPEVVERLSRARDMGDLSENAEYTAAREELDFIDSRIAELEELLKQVVIIDDSSKGNQKAVIIGSKVTLKLDGKKEEYTVVGEWEANPAERKISHESPLGKALMGKTIGEEIHVQAPAGTINYIIEAIA